MLRGQGGGVCRWQLDAMTLNVFLSDTIVTRTVGRSSLMGGGDIDPRGALPPMCPAQKNCQILIYGNAEKNNC